MNNSNNSKSGQSGFTPQITKIFDASGQITAFADYGVPIGLNFGINVLNGYYTKQISIVEQPDIHAQAKVSGTSSIAGGTKIGDTACAGISYEIDFTNKVYFVIPAVKGPPSQKSLFSTKIPAIKGCVTLLNSELAPSIITFQTDVPTSETLGAKVSPAITAAVETIEQLTSSTGISEITTLPTLEPTFSNGNLSISMPRTTIAVDTTIADDPATTATVLLPIESATATLPNAAKVTDIVDVDESSSDGETPYTPEDLDPLDTSVDPSDDLGEAADRTAVIDNDLKSANFTSAPIIQAESSLMMKFSKDENLYLDPYGSDDLTNPLASTFAITEDGLVSGPVGGQLFHYYTNEIAAYNVSRFRASSLDEMPTTANAVFLKPISDENLGLVAVDTLGSFFYVLTCIVVDRGAMTFIVTDPDAGMKVLRSEAVRELITGGTVADCLSAALTVGQLTD